MTREQALQALGLASGALPSKIEAAYKEKRKKVMADIRAAETQDVKVRLRRDLDLLEALRRIALQVEAHPEVPSDRTFAAEAAFRVTPPVARASPPAPGTPPDQSPAHAEEPSAGWEQTRLDSDRPASDQRPATKSPIDRLEIGQILMDRYEVLDLLGVGGMGAVYRAYDQNLGKQIAIKVLLPHFLDNSVARERFFLEAKISVALSHPNIVNVFDLQREGTFYFLAMELLEGHSLREEMKKRRLQKNRFSIPEIMQVAKSICDALSYAHQYSVHRDVKPENVWLCKDGTIKLMDFGIARMLDSDRVTMTMAGTGTAYYMAPEQLKGAKDLDHRADQYSVAVMLYEMLTGDVPTGRMESARNLRNDTPKKMSAALDQALSVKATDRFPSMDQFLQAFSSGDPSWRKLMDVWVLSGFVLHAGWQGF
ncbi:MAG: serine/threonine-protein kinase [Thermodesulfobacteriota bacterium]